MSLLRQYEIDPLSGNRGRRCSHSSFSFFKHTSRKEDCGGYISRHSARAHAILRMSFNISVLWRIMISPLPENAGEKSHSVDERGRRFYPFGVNRASMDRALVEPSMPH